MTSLPGRIGTVVGRFWFYRRRRVLPFSAVWALVFINGATLAPLAVPAGCTALGATDPTAAADCRGADTTNRLHYERRGGTEPEPAVVAAAPPIVKNLRRHVGSRHVKAASCGTGTRPEDAVAPKTELVQCILAANAADLSRLCRRLL